MDFAGADKRGVGEEGGEADAAVVVGRPRTDGRTVRLHGPAHVVGVLVGCHGTRHVLRRLCNGYRHVRVLCYHA